MLCLLFRQFFVLDDITNIENCSKVLPEINTTCSITVQHVGPTQMSTVRFVILINNRKCAVFKGIPHTLWNKNGNFKIMADY